MQRLILFFTEINQYSGHDWSDAVDDGFGEVIFPLAFPGCYDILHLIVAIYNSCGYIFGMFSDLFFIHG